MMVDLDAIAAGAAAAERALKRQPVEADPRDAEIARLRAALLEIEPHMGGLVEAGIRHRGRFHPEVRDLRAKWTRAREALGLPPVPFADEDKAENARPLGHVVQ